jgi:8-oxo-dGTP diphosphatase
MPFNKEEYYNIIETSATIFTVDKGEIKVLLLRKKTEPYRGYWILPGNFLKNDEELENNIKTAIYDKVGYKNLSVEQHQAYNIPDRVSGNRVINNNFIALVDSKTAEIKKEVRESETEWFNINAIPKMAFDHSDIVEDAIKSLRKKIVNSNVLKSLFPSDFTLPEIQGAYEQILGKELDRRNFRKKFIALGLIEDTGYKNENYTGRPAKLYRFKEEIRERDLF